MIRHFLASSAMFLVMTLAVAGQDSASAFPHAPDPARNRVTFMSTGQIMPPKRFTASLHEFFVVQLGYAPDDRVQFNATATLLPVYYSIGTKVQLIEPSGYFQGLAAGTDIGIVPDSHWQGVYTAHIAASAGTDRLALHGNVMAISTDGLNPSRFNYVAQAGTSIEVANTGTAGAKFLGEVWLRPDPSKLLNPVGGIIGIRSYGPVTTWEAGMIFSPGITIAAHTAATIGTILPYLSFGVAL